MSAVINEEQFLELYDQYVEKIYRYIYFRVGSEQHAQDLTSEVFLRCWQHFNQPLNPKPPTTNLDNPRAFFYQVARNLIVDFHRQRDKAPLSLEEITDKKIADKKDGPGETVMKTLEIEQVKNALTRLNEDYQEVIIWRYVDELEIREIAEILNKSEGAVRVLLSRALASLKKVLSQV